MFATLENHSMGHRDLPLSTRTVSVTGNGLPEIMGQPALVFSKLTGTERLCELFQYELELKTPDEQNALFGPAANLDTNALRGQEVTVTIALDGNGTGLEGGFGAGAREITGIVTDIHGPIPDGRQIKYRLTLRPWLWLATRNRDFRIFQQQSVVEILDTLLADYIFPVELRLDVARYPRREYQVQYGESDFEFFQRLTQEWGIAWHIAHRGGKHRLVLTDSNSAFAPFASTAYHNIRWQPSADRIDEEHLHAFELHDRVVSGQWTSSDYDFVKPTADLTVRASDPLDTAHADAEVREWPGDHSQPATGNDPWAEGNQIARLRMEALRQHGRRASGAGNVRAMVPGRTFKLTHFLQDEANREYLILGTQLLIEDVPEASGGSQPWRCEVAFTAQPSNELFRPERTQPKPRTTGPQTATVVGPAGEETWTDAFGRVRLQFHWDRIGQRDANSTCWVRAASPWQGERFGAIQIPRIGQEVIVDFLNGDPDCPIITGRVPNRDNMPQWPLPAQHALSGFVSKELHGGRTNTFVQDDTEGQIQTQLQSDHRSSWLSLGFITRVLRGQGRKDKRGEGFELRTDAQGVVRAGGGMLVTTELRQNAQAHHKDLGETVQRLTVARDQQETFAELAQEHEAQEPGDQAEVARTIQAQNDDIRGKGSANPETGSFPELSAPHLVLASPAGIEATTPKSMHLATGEHLALTSTGHASLAVGQKLLASVSRGVRVFIQSLGWRLVAFSGDIDLRALQNSVNLLAKLNVTATANRITISAKEALVISGGGSGTTYSAGGITHKTPAAYTVHAGGYTVTTAATQLAQFPGKPKPGQGNLEVFNQYANRLGIKGGDFRVEDALGKVVKGTLDAKGFAAVSGIAPGPARVTFGQDPADTWAKSSHVGHRTWPKQGARPTSSEGTSPALPGVIASQVLQMGRQVANADKAGPAGLASLGLSGAQALLSKVLPSTAPILSAVSGHIHPTTARMPGPV
ncbi:type VI secretion system Vgr family protein [Ralstonia sp. UBA689]|uniref:type VI secretion system Vgr family protein n=1 Tax=Ralstonia sp. UBA689 TaxID=1947373 RepID=UPI0025E0EA59|nr:type VI secretion system Vgr family protein [Ralstonia sp. UBA689]